MLYLENYGPYAELIQNKKMTIKASSINKENWEMHYNSVLNIMKDAIETEYLRTVFITVEFEQGITVDLSVQDYWFNVIMWSLIVAVDETISSTHLFFDNALTRKAIKKYIDFHLIDKHRIHLSNIQMNNIIDDCMSKYRDIDKFSMYLSNTINLYDFITLMNQYPEFRDLVHIDLSNIPIGEVKKVGLECTNKVINYIMNSDHCLANFFRAEEGVSIKQFKEFAVNIGPKPDGRGGVFPTIINTNFITGGVNDILSFTIESSVGRIAQIIVKDNVGESGYFARLLGLNNADSFLNPDPNFICNSKNFQIIEIKNGNMLSRLKNRYYRLNPNGMEYLLREGDSHLIGQTIYLRSPMTCASAAKGKGICHRCYGDLAKTNSDINIGKLAAELISSVLTQKMLSAKHLLESSVKEMKWTPEFEELFNLDYNIISVNDQMKGYKLVIDPDTIFVNNEDAETEFNEYITEFDIITPNKKVITIHTQECDNMYLTYDLYEVMHKCSTKSVDNKIIMKFEDLEDLALFAIQIHNNDLSKMLKRVQEILDKSATVKMLDRNSILQLLTESLCDGGLNVDSVHTEIILMNQLRNVDNILDTPEWEYPNEPCNILTLKQSLNNNPSVTVSLSYQYINKMLYNPLTYRKHKASFMDLFFMTKPQMYLNKDSYISTEDIAKENMVDAMKRVE